MLTEIVASDVALHSKAQMPPSDIQESKLMRIEEDYKDCTTSLAFFEAWPKVETLATGDFSQAKDEEGQWHFEAAILDGLEQLELSHLQNWQNMC